MYWGRNMILGSWMETEMAFINSTLKPHIVIANNNLIKKWSST